MPRRDILLADRTLAPYANGENPLTLRAPGRGEWLGNREGSIIAYCNNCKEDYYVRESEIVGNSLSCNKCHRPTVLIDEENDPRGPIEPYVAPPPPPQPQRTSRGFRRLIFPFTSTEDRDAFIQRATYRLASLIPGTSVVESRAGESVPGVTFRRFVVNTPVNGERTTTTTSSDSQAALAVNTANTDAHHTHSHTHTNIHTHTYSNDSTSRLSDAPEASSAQSNEGLSSTLEEAEEQAAEAQAQNEAESDEIRVEILAEIGENNQTSPTDPSTREEQHLNPLSQVEILYGFDGGPTIVSMHRTVNIPMESPDRSRPAPTNPIDVSRMFANDLRRVIEEERDRLRSQQPAQNATTNDEETRLEDNEAPEANTNVRPDTTTEGTNTTTENRTAQTLDHIASVLGFLHWMRPEIRNSNDPEFHFILENFHGRNRDGNVPSAPDAVQALERHKVDDDVLKKYEGNLECMICLQDMETGETITKMPCKHWYHDECLGTWLSSHNTCPLCRKPIAGENPTSRFVPLAARFFPTNPENPEEWQSQSEGIQFNFTRPAPTEFGGNNSFNFGNTGEGPGQIHAAIPALISLIPGLAGFGGESRPGLNTSRWPRPVPPPSVHVEQRTFQPTPLTQPVADLLRHPVFTPQMNAQSATAATVPREIPAETPIQRAARLQRVLPQTMPRNTRAWGTAFADPEAATPQWTNPEEAAFYQPEHTARMRGSSLERDRRQQSNVDNAMADAYRTQDVNSAEQAPLFMRPPAGDSLPTFFGGITRRDPGFQFRFETAEAPPVAIGRSMDGSADGQPSAYSLAGRGEEAAAHRQRRRDLGREDREDGDETETSGRASDFGGILGMVSRRFLGRRDDN